ncbi:ROK family protein [Rhodobacter sp. HX-7-19]|uniref:N-acetylglucosamine kinase n=1 Tax=Paragemmobacter kunshanensis TaxID=2583234 RepID=A0A6M1U9R2_9RHOB|nr:ROK family protein [Rhodobacter kunshanensis]NGQ91301.1 ROK family protein [Rhodobacter kunshanensis]
MILCFDIGGSRIKAALSKGGALSPLGDAPTPTQDFDTFRETLAGFARGRDLRGVAISIAGVVDPESQSLRVANIPCADGRCLAPELSAALRLPVLVLNDADCFAMAEARQGAGQGHRTVFGVILGTGVGGGLVIDGRLVSGPGGYAGEWGHGPVARTQVEGMTLPEFACGCGLNGCLDTIGGARGIERLHLTLTGEAASSHRILSDWQAGQSQAGKTVAVWRSLLAPPLAMIVNTVGASIVPVGGGLSNVPDLVATLDEAVRSMILRHGSGPLVVPAQCRIEPGLIGAAAMGEVTFA